MHTPQFDLLPIFGITPHPPAAEQIYSKAITQKSQCFTTSPHCIVPGGAARFPNRKFTFNVYAKVFFFFTVPTRQLDDRPRPRFILPNSKLHSTVKPRNVLQPFFPVRAKGFSLKRALVVITKKVETETARWRGDCGMCAWFRRRESRGGQVIAFKISTQLVIDGVWAGRSSDKSDDFWVLSSVGAVAWGVTLNWNL